MKRSGLAVCWLGAWVTMAMACGGKVVVDGTGDGGSPPSMDVSSGASTCIPKTCADLAGSCGELPDGCGAVVACPCPPACGSQTVGPGLVVDDASVGTRAWDNPGNASNLDGVEAEVSAMIEHEVSHYLKATNFGFNIPEDATIQGIVIQWQAGPLSGVGLEDHGVRAVRGGEIGTEDRSAPGTWTVKSGRQYGGPTDLWGEAWTPAQINAPGFGAALSVWYNDFAGNDWPQVDAVQITVFYAGGGC